MTSRYLLRGGCVLTLGARTQNFVRADVIIDGDRVAEIGSGLRARDAETVDAADAIVMPGFVDAHRHASRSLSRNLGDAASASPDAALRPDEVYAATLIGLLGAAEAGITTVVDWSEARSEAASREAALTAHADSGLRTVFVHQPREGSGGADAMEALVPAAGPLTTLALGIAGGGDRPHDRVEADVAEARRLGLAIQVHAVPEAADPSVTALLVHRGLLGPDVTLLHASAFDQGTIEAVASAGASVTLTPASDMAGGRGGPPVQQLIDHRIQPGLGVDHELLAPGDLFAQMRALISVQHATVFDRKLSGKAGLPRLMNTRDVIRHATADGARAAGLSGVTGSLEPGMAADVIVLRTDRPNVFPVNDPIGAVVWGMDTSNLDWVFAGGRPLMREGVLTADVQRARDLVAVALGRTTAGPGLSVGAAWGGDG